MKLNLALMVDNTLAKLNEKNASELAKAIYDILQKNKKLSFLERFTDILEKKYFGAQGKTIAEVTTRRELNKEEQQEIAAKLKNKYNREIEIKNIVDEKILGGMKILVNDETTDLSTRAELITLQAKMAGEKQ